MQRRTIAGILSLPLMLGSFAFPLPDWKQEPEPPDFIQKLYDQLTRPPG
jgi:hypothetical protein